MNINWAALTIDIFNLDYPPIINVFRQPSELFSLNSSHALTHIVLGCSSAYEMHVCQFKYSLITYTRIIQITQSCYVIIYFITSKLAHLG